MTTCKNQRSKSQTGPLAYELARGSSAVTTVFVQKGKNLHLDVNKPVVLVEYTEFKWTINNTCNVVRLFPDNTTRISDSYKGRVEFYVQNHSLLLKNVQHSDSGDYTALITGEKNQRVAEYNVIIQDPVSPVQLSVNSVSNSTESCNLTVTCSTEDSLISSTFRCDNQTCNQEGGEQSENTTSGSSLRVYLLNDFIICNHSNQVSWTSNMTEIQHFCPLTAETERPGSYLGIAIGIGIVIVVFLLCICFLYKRHTNQQKRKNSENEIYECFQDINLNQTPYQNATEDTSGLSPNSVYALPTDYNISSDHNAESETEEDIPRMVDDDIQRSSAVTTVFVQKGKNLHLDVNKPVVLGKDNEFKWTMNNTHNVVRLFPDKITKILDSDEGRVEFSEQNHSLLLKNVQHNDSGDYTALITGDTNQPLAEYKVIIQDPVSPVQLSVNSVSNSRESCNLTVTCSTEDSLISSTFRCDTQTCNQEGGEQSEVTTSGSSLRVYLLNDFIICNHSNQVSWTRDMKEIRPLCSLNAGFSLYLVRTVVLSVGLIIMVSAVISVHLMKRLNK
ncbi:uncharacterized protein LOC128369698 [Scomber scombrus]|uniref:Uncharacterized protein LOC128369698 n=1 Tax=Scomber scombrus TaxID=13677 RepID=A0AAV1QI12_SCOSC